MRVLASWPQDYLAQLFAHAVDLVVAEIAQHSRDCGHMQTPSPKGTSLSHMNKHHNRAIRHEVGRGANRTCLTFGVLVHVPHRVTYHHAVDHKVSHAANQPYHQDNVHLLLLDYMSAT